MSTEHLPHVKLRVLDKESTCVLEVVQGKVDAFIYGQLSIHRDWQRNRDTTRAILTPLRAEYWAVGVRKGNHGPRRQVNEFLRTFRETGGFDRLSDHYLETEKTAFEQMGIPFLFRFIAALDYLHQRIHAQCSTSQCLHL